MKLISPPENRAPPKLTSPPDNSAARKPTLPPENSAKPKPTPPPENSTALKSTSPRENFAVLMRLESCQIYQCVNGHREIWLGGRVISWLVATVSPGGRPVVLPVLVG